MKAEEKREILRALGISGNIGFSLAFFVLVGLFLGQWIDDNMNTFPLALIICMGTGIIAWYWNIYRVSRWK